MRRPLRTRLERLADYAVPWGVGIFLALVVTDEHATPALLGIALAAVQGIALRWRRRQPERVMAVAVVAGLGYQLIVPEVVLPIAGFFAIESLAATRPPRSRWSRSKRWRRRTSSPPRSRTRRSRWRWRSGRGRSARPRATAVRRSARRPAARSARSRRASRASCTT